MDYWVVGLILYMCVIKGNFNFGIGYDGLIFKLALIDQESTWRGSMNAIGS